MGGGGGVVKRAYLYHRLVFALYVYDLKRRSKCISM
jgi:hypothetical protein